MECLIVSVAQINTPMDINDGKSKINGCRCNLILLSRIMQAALLVCFVPLVQCEDWPTLTFDQIYNHTNYAQLQKYKPRPFRTLTDYSINNHSFRILEGNTDYNLNSDSSITVPDLNSHSSRSLEGKGGNEVENGHDLKMKVKKGWKEPLLVGFSHDPFRYSVPEDDYLKGVRDMTPKSIMNKGENRGKRGVLHLYNMMFCATGCEPLAYKGYGCYCGFLGSGKPTDGIDNCCRLHDKCYEHIYCPFYTVYFQPYYWKCYKGEPLCAVENSHTSHKLINGCAARLCECDRKFAMCVKQFPCPTKRALCRSSPLRLLQNLLMFR